MRRGRLAWVAVLMLVAAVTWGRPGDGHARARGRAPATRRADAERALRAGRYEEALRLAGGGAGTDRAAATILAARAEEALGLYDEARRRLAVAEESAPDSLPLRDALMRLYELTGDRAALAPLIDRTYDDWKEHRVDRGNAADLIAVATAVRLDNNWKDASDTLRAAVTAADPARGPAAAAAYIDWGWIYLEKHAASDAEARFQEALKLDAGDPDARVGLARAFLDQRYDVDAASLELDRALAVNPRHAGALALRAELALDSEDFAAAAARVADIRRTNPRDGGAAAVAGAAALLLDDRAGYQRERDHHREAHGADGAFYAFVAEALVRQRRYDEARAVAEEGVKADAQHARCLTTLGTTLLRLGDEDAGLDALRRSFKRDPYDARTVNLLNLFEKVIPARYTTVETAHLRFRIEPEARPAVEAVVGPFLEETYRRYVERYGVAPAGPVVFELYGDPSHYAVRTVGLPAIGVAGVCFGRVITSQSPTNHAFNWGMVLAHELAHVFAIQISRSRVPRWFTEGLSELETMRARPEWTRHDDAALWGALRTGRLPTLVDLSTAFVHAHSAEDALQAYAHAAAALDFFERRFGFARIRSALEAYGRGQRGPGVLEQMAGLPADEIERQFRADLQQRLARYDGQYLPTQSLRRPRAEAESRAALPHARPLALIEAGLAQLADGDRRAAELSLARANALAAEGKAAGRPAEPDEAAAIAFLTGELALASRQAGAAVEALQALIGDPKGAADGGAAAASGQAGNHDGYDARIRLALAEIHRHAAAAAERHLRRAIAFDPTRVEPHALLAELHADTHQDADRLSDMEDALLLEPQNGKLAKTLVLGLGRAGRPGKVVDLAPIAIFIDPADPDLHAALGRALAATGKNTLAAAALERALLFEPADGPDLHRALAGLYDKLGDGRRAASHRAAAKAPPAAGGQAAPRAIQ